MCKMLNASSFTTAPSSSTEDTLLSTLALPASPAVERFSESYSEEDDYDNEEETLVLADLEEDSSQSSDITVDDWLPKRKLGSMKACSSRSDLVQCRSAVLD